MSRPTALTRSVAVLVSAAYSALLFGLGFALPTWARLLTSTIPTLAVLSVVLWDILLWRLPVVQGLTRRPNLRGLWQVTLLPHPDSHIPPGGNRGPIPGFLEVQQTYWSIHLRLYTEQSSSKSSAASWLPTYENKVDELTFTYANTPKVSESHRSMRSDGACNLTPASLKPSEIEGTYFTDRFTKGDMTLRFVDRTNGYASFATATDHAEEKTNASN